MLFSVTHCKTLLISDCNIHASSRGYFGTLVIVNKRWHPATLSPYPASSLTTPTFSISLPLLWLGWAKSLQWWLPHLLVCSIFHCDCTIYLLFIRVPNTVTTFRHLLPATTAMFQDSFRPATGSKYFDLITNIPTLMCTFISTSWLCGFPGYF